jgi:hypothetical protein
MLLGRPEYINIRDDNAHDKIRKLLLRMLLVFLILLTSMAFVILIQLLLTEKAKSF